MTMRSMLGSQAIVIVPTRNSSAIGASSGSTSRALHVPTEVGEPALCRALGLPEDAPRGVVVAELRSLQTAAVPGPLDEFAEWLATGLVTVVNMMAPELVVLGDLFTALPELEAELARTA